MLWLFLGLLSAFLDATRLALSKKLLKENDVFVVATITRLSVLPFFIIYLLFVPLPEINLTFWIAVSVAILIGLIANLLQLYSIKISPLSLTAPFTSFTPIFILLFSPFLLNEMPSFIGLIGIILAVIGVYILNINELKDGFLTPFKAILREKGSLVMLFVAFLFAVTATFDKLGIKNSDPLFYLAINQIVMSILYIPIMINKSENYKEKIRKDLFGLFIIGLITIGSVIAQFFALKLALVSYVISLKRMSAIFGVLYGGILFKEEKIIQRFIAALIIVGSIVFIALG